MRRHKIQLGAEPSGIATVAALLSKSKFPKELTPSDNILAIEETLGNYRFVLLENGGVDYIKPASEENA